MTASLPVLLGTGSREYADGRTLEARAGRLLGRGPVLVFDGMAEGFDTELHAWAVRHRAQCVQPRRFPADWEGPDGKRAGHVRNQEMVDEALTAEQRYALIGLHPGALNHGTLDCAQRILAADIPWEAWWGATGLTRSRPVGLDELEALIAAAEKAKAAKQAAKRREARDGWMEALDV